VADQRHGVAVSVLANINRSAKDRPEPYAASDFISWRETGPAKADDELVLLADPVAQSNLMRAALFGKGPG
jgi:hypothetical protein